MNLIFWGKTDRILICEELEVEGARKKMKALIVEVFRATGVDAAEILESLDLAKDRQRNKSSKRRNGATAFVGRSSRVNSRR